MRIAVQYFEGCPGWEVARSRAEEALRPEGVDAPVVLERIDTQQQAERSGFRGSPTLLINGKDPFADPEALPGFSCRVYETGAGSQQAPSIEQLRAAIASAGS